MKETKEHIVSLFESKGILSSRSGLVRRPYCWKKRFDEEAKTIFKEFAKEYRTEEEAWFCLCRNIELPICPICMQNKVKFTGLTKNGGKGYNTTCEECSANAVPEKKARVRSSMLSHTPEELEEFDRKRRATNLLRYGEENAGTYGSHTFKALMRRRYGNEYYNNTRKRQKTCLEKYGVKSNLLIPDIRKKSMRNSWSEECRERRRANSLLKYGTEVPICNPIINKKGQETKRRKVKEIEKKHNCMLLASVTRKYGSGYKHIGLEYLRIDGRVYVQNRDLPIIEEYSREGTHTNKYSSKPEKEVLDFIKSIYSGIVIENCTSIVPNGNHRFFELDIYIPDLKLAIDYDGTYWHSLKYKDENYHQRKTEYCRRVGVKMLHVFEDMWKNDKERCKDIITSCIDGTLVNGEWDSQRGCYVGDNAIPIIGEYIVIGVTKPQRKIDGKNIYCDCGKIFYLKEKTNERSQHREQSISAA